MREPGRNTVRLIDIHVRTPGISLASANSEWIQGFYYICVKSRIEAPYILFMSERG